MTVEHRVGAVGGRPVLCKVADPGPDADRLAHEAAMLRAAAHPGVAALVEERLLDGGGRELVVALAGSRTLADVRTDLAGAAGLVAALAATIADLHDVGLVHGRLEAEHVVVDRLGRPVLCGLAGAELIAAGSDPAGDVEGLGRLLAGLVERCSPPPAPPRSVAAVLARWRAADRSAAAVRRSLLDVAARATAEVALSRPPARAFGAAVLAAHPAAELPCPPVPQQPLNARPDEPSADAAAFWGRAAGDDGARPWRLLVPTGAVLGLGLLAFGIGGLLRPPAARSASSVATAPPTTGPSTTATATTAPPTPPATAAPVEPAPSTSAPVVEIDGRRYTVGEPGDVAVVGDWDCDGSATVALLRPATGAVFVFEGWATSGADLTVRSVATVAGAAGLAADDPDGDGCSGLVAVGADGARTPVVEA